MSRKSLSDWLSDIESRVRGEAIQLGLERVSNAYRDLALGPYPFKVITVAGTNGKGSTVKLVESLLIAHGHQVASFTSPHLVDFNERIKIGGEPVSDEIIIHAFRRIETVATLYQLTYFEWVVVAALVIFHQTPLDYVVLEVGLGGRFDAVNIIDSDVAVITSISLDHQKFLGDTLSAIAKEKAGIMRSNRPVILGEKAPQPTLFDEGLRRGALVIAPFRDKDILLNESDWSYVSKSLVLENIPYPQLLVENAINALAVIELLGIAIDKELVKQVIATTTVPGRQEWLDDGELLMDVAHNEASITSLAETIKNIKRPVKLVFAMRADKDYQRCFRLLEPHIGQAYVSSLSPMTSDDLTLMQDYFKGYSNVCFFDDVMSAYQALLADKQSQDVVVVCGSFQTVGMIKKSRYTLSSTKVNTHRDIVHG